MCGDPNGSARPRFRAGLGAIGPRSRRPLRRFHDEAPREVCAARFGSLRAGFDFSLNDEHHDQYEYARSASLPHLLKGRPFPNGVRDHRRSIDDLHAQNRESHSNYGPVDILWWDDSALDFEGDEAWRAGELIAIVWSLQTFDHHQSPPPP